MLKRYCSSKSGILTVLTCAALLLLLMGGIDKAESCYTAVVHMPGEEPCWDPCEGECGTPPNQPCYDECYARKVHTGIQSAIDAIEMDFLSCFLGGPGSDCSLDICPGTYIENVVTSYPFQEFTASQGNVVIVADDPNKPVLYIIPGGYIPDGQLTFQVMLVSGQIVLQENFMFRMPGILV